MTDEEILDTMLDINLIRNNPDFVKAALAKREYNFSLNLNLYFLPFETISFSL